MWESDLNSSGPVSPPSTSDERILEALGDRVSRRILQATTDKARTARELELQLSLPHSSVYRKIHELESLSLLGVQQFVFTPEGKKVELFRSRVQEVRIEMRGPELKVDVRYRDLRQDRLASMWNSMRQEVRR
jgi:DNA-binding transcriptional ArsR family regulator